MFALDHIHVPPLVHKGLDEVSLFPYVGPTYRKRDWKILLAQYLVWKVYQLDLDTDPSEVLVRLGQGRVIDGDPVQSSDLFAYINSSKGTRPPQQQNVEWHQIVGPPAAPYF